MSCCLLALLPLLQLIDPPPRIERLANGLRVVIVEDRTQPLVSVQLWYRVGSAGDAPTRPGLCHVARTILEQRNAAALELRGVRCESKTLRDACRFSSFLPPDFLEDVLDLEAKRMRPLDVTAEMVKSALAAAARDYGLERDEPARLGERQLLAAMFPNHPYQHPPGFVAESLKDLEPIDVQEFLARWFVPGNATLLVIGDVSTVQALELVRERFGKLPWREPPRRAELKPPAAETVRTSTTTPRRPGLDIAWLTLPMGYYENAALDVLMQHLCNPVDGPLCKRLLEAGCPPPRWHRRAWRHGGLLVLSIDPPPNDWEGEAPAEPSSGNDEPADDRMRAQRELRPPAGTPRAQRELRPPAGTPLRPAAGGLTRGLSSRASPTLEDLERIVRAELAKAVQAIPTEIEHNRARALAMRNVRNRRAAFDDRAHILATHEIIAGDLLIAELELPRLQRVAVADVQQAALALQTARTVVLRRLAQTPDRRQDSRERTAALPRPLKAAAPRPATTTAALEPPAASAAAITHELANGVKVIFRRVPGRELAEVRTLLEERAVLSAAVGALMAVGSRRHSVDQIRDYLSYHGLDLFPLMGCARAGLRARGPAARLPQMIELQAELLRQPRCDEAAGRLAAGRIRAFLQSHTGSDPRDEAGVYLPPGLIGWIPAMAALPDADLHQALRRLEHVRAVEVLVVADAEPQRVFDAVELAWGDWSP